MYLQKDKKELQNFTEAIQSEWIETNGIGGWSSGTLLGCNTRRYHSLLVAATHPPAIRMALVSKLDETIVTNNNRFELVTNNYGNTIYPTGYQYLESFSKELFPEFTFNTGGIRLRKTVTMIHGENSTLVMYDVLEAENPFSLELLPLLAVRDY